MTTPSALRDLLDSVPRPVADLVRSLLTEGEAPVASVHRGHHNRISTLVVATRRCLVCVDMSREEDEPGSLGDINLISWPSVTNVRVYGETVYVYSEVRGSRSTISLPLTSVPQAVSLGGELAAYLPGADAR